MTKKLGDTRRFSPHLFLFNRILLFCVPFKGALSKKISGCFKKDIPNKAPSRVLPSVTKIWKLTLISEDLSAEVFLGTGEKKNTLQATLCDLFEKKKGYGLRSGGSTPNGCVR